MALKADNLKSDFKEFIWEGSITKLLADAN